jgi:glycosyltransferase involved in cell wall biosynthesis
MAKQNSASRPGEVAVVIPAYNHAAYVAEAVASAVAQGPCVTEILVVDDGSPDRTADAVRAITEPRLRLFVQSNRGPSAARNAGWQATKAPWVFFLDADDTLAPNAIPALLAAASIQSEPVIPYGFEEVFHHDFQHPADFTAELSTRDGNLLGDVGVNYRGTIFVALFPRPALEQVDGFDETVHYGEDFDFAVRLARRFQFAYVKVPTYRARMHGTNRHRTFSDEAYAQYVSTVRRAFAGDWSPRHRLIRQRGLAHLHWVRGMNLQSVGRRDEARVAFRSAALTWPLKFDAWRKWGATFRG